MDNNYTIDIPVDKPHYRNAFILVYLIDTALNRAKIQKLRIEIGKSDHSRMVELFADIHFLLITLGNLNKLLPELGIILKNDSDYEKICVKCLPSLEKISFIRNHLEHILDGRLEGKGYKGKALLQPNIFGDLVGNDYNFGGDIFNLLDAFELCSNLENELKIWNKKSLVYPVWH